VRSVATGSVGYAARRHAAPPTLRDLVTWLLGLAIVAGLATVVVVREGNLAWDDADYLRRGLHNLGRAEAGGRFDLVRLVAETLKERPKPPWLVAWIEAGALLLGRRNLAPLLVFASAGPFALLLAAVAIIGRRRFGARASLLGVLVLAASPMALSFGAKVMVETFMALWVLLVLDAASAVLEQPTQRRALYLGTALAGALLTKLTVALILPVPALVFLGLYVRRRPLDRTALRMVFWVTVPILVLAAPWYARNGRSAIEFAFFSARYDVVTLAQADVTPRLQRIQLLFDRIAGRPFLLLLPVAAWGVYRRRTEWSQSTGDYVLLTLLGLGSGAAILLVPSYFDPRFLLPIWAAVAVVAGGGLAQLMVVWAAGTHLQHRPLIKGRSKLRLLPLVRGGWGGCVQPAALVVHAALLVGIAGSATEIAREPRTVTYWRTRDLIDDLVAQHHIRTLANIGDGRDWNVCKTGLINELRRSPGDCFVLHDLSRSRPEELERRLGNLDAVVVLERDRLQPGFLDESPGLNRAYDAIGHRLPDPGHYRKVVPQVAGLPPLSIYVRRR
jgi:4-amino-4-deoxy-L-arabinose transferase-like glycosyltransferase